jgi:hypothetical protein
VQCEALSRVDTSVGVSGRHDFAVRDRRIRLVRLLRPPHPAPNVRDDRDTPLLIGRGTCGKMPLICPTTQAKGLRHFNTTGKSLEQPQMLSSEEQLLKLPKPCANNSSNTSARRL